MDEDIAEILIPRHRIAERVAELADELGALYGADSGELTLVTILSGSVIFLADLIRHLPIKMRIGLITVSSYAGPTTTSCGPTIVGELPADVADRDVLVIDDILDTGRTLRCVTKQLAVHQPRSLRTCVLLRKPAKAPPDVRADFVGFDIEDRFVVGYGLDFNGLYRNYPHLAVLRPELYTADAHG